MEYIIIAIIATIVFPPVGLLAVLKSISSMRLIKAGRENEAKIERDISRQLSSKAFTVGFTLLAAFYMLALVKSCSTGLAKDAAIQSAIVKGRQLYVSIIEANIERESKGLVPIWPHLSEKDGLDPSAKDDDPIVAFRFLNSDDYFAVLFDLSARTGKPDWKPYVSCPNDNESIRKLVGALNLSGENHFNVGWIVAAGLTEDMVESVPVLISANIDPKWISVRENRELSEERIPIGKEAGRRGLVGAWEDKCVVVVRKGGTVEVIPALDFNMRSFYKGVAPENCIEYLDVKR